MNINSLNKINLSTDNKNLQMQEIQQNSETVFDAEDQDLINSDDIEFNDEISSLEELSNNISTGSQKNKSKIIENLKDFFQKIPKKNKTISEKTFLKIGTLAKYAKLPVAGELLQISLMNKKQRTKYIQKKDGQILTPKQIKPFLTLFGLSEGNSGHTTSEQMKLDTIIFNNDSKISQEVQSNKLLNKLVNEWNQNGAIEDQQIPFPTANSGSTDLRLGLGYSIIVGLHKTEDGHAEGYIEDVYDYDKIYNKGEHEEDGFIRKIKSKATQELNDIALDLQNEGKLHNYRVLIPIRIKLDT